MPHRRVVIAAWSLGILFSACLCLIIGEFALRTLHLVRDRIAFFEAPSGRVGAIMLDSRLGWRATANYVHDTWMTSQHGRVYPVHRAQGTLGFRSYGNIRAQRPKLLVIGDSFTQATAVSDDQTYHARLGHEVGMDVFAYGAGGYGTLQEYLILDEVLDHLQPTMLLWQFCSNDFINNDYALEKASTLNNNGWPRPYWEAGHIVLRSPKPVGAHVRDWIHNHSRFFYFVMSRVERLQARVESDSVEHAITREGMAHPGFARSVQITDELMGRVRARVGGLPIYAFNCDTDEPYTTAFEMIARHHGIQYWKEVPESVQGAIVQGRDVLAADGHCNDAGHAVIAETLGRHFKRLMPLLERQASIYTEAQTSRPTFTR
jgi:hypothetical protein